MDDLTLRTFVAVCERRSFRAAGEAVGRTQSAVSQQIKGLEAELGVQLFERSTRSVAMTPAGETFYRHADRLLSFRQEAVSATRSVSQRPVLRVGAADDIAAYGLVPSLRTIEQAGDGCMLHLETQPSRTLLESLGQKFDLVIVVAPPGTVAGELVAEVPLVWLGAPHLTKLQILPLAVYADKCAMREAAIASLDASGLKWVNKATVSGLLVIEAAVRAAVAVAPALAHFHAPDLPVLRDLPALPALDLRVVSGSPLGERYLPGLVSGLRGLAERCRIDGAA